MEEKITVYETQIEDDPAFDRYHHSMYTSIGFFNAFNTNWPVYKLEMNGSSVYYTEEKNRISVLGTLNQYTDEEIDMFCAYFFAHYRVRYVNWGGFYHPDENGTYQAQKTASVSDIIMDLPKDENTWLQSLDKATRKHVPYYKRRFLREYPDAELKVYRKEEISEELIRKIVHFNHLRMEEKNTHSDLDEADTVGTYKLCQYYGCVHTVELNGELLGATIDPELYGHGHLAVIAHDPAYNKYNIGQIALYETICDSIRAGDVRFHFLWEMSDYKRRFGGHLVELYYYHIYPGTSLRSITDGVKCKVTCSLMYFQKRSETGRKIIDRVKKMIGMK